MYSLQTRMKALAIAGVMAASVAGSTVSAFAEETSAEAAVKTVETPKVQKHVYYPSKGVKTPDMPAGEKSFRFTATFTKSSLEDQSKGKAPNKFVAEVTPGEWSKAADGEWTQEVEIKPATNGFTWNNVVPGCYEYALTEDELYTGGYKALDQYGFGWTYNKPETKYTLRVYVSNNTDKETQAKKPKVVKYTLISTADEKDENGETKIDDSKKTEVASFSNIYTVRGGSNTPNVPEGEEDPALTVSKVANHEYDDKTKQFEFYISFTYPTIEDEVVKPHYTENGELKEGIVSKKYASNNTEEYNFKLTTPEDTSKGQYTFTLADGEKVAFVNLPAGTTYTITEAGAQQYKVQGFSYISNSSEKSEVTVTAKVGEAYTATTEVKDWNVIGEKHNEINFTNTREDITITGVVTHSAPFVIMVGALFVAVGGYVVLKKRIEE